MNCDPVLVAPRPVRVMSVPQSLLRPVRLVAASESIERVASSLEELKVSVSDKEQASPRSSPRKVQSSNVIAPSVDVCMCRSGLPTEALEEFLSILKPFRPHSPIFARRQTSASFPSAHRGFARMKGDFEESEIARSASPLNSEEPDVDCSSDDLLPFRWFSSSVLSSPISRMHTRNPFQRQRSYPELLSPSPLASISPAAIPLPLPTPDEMLETS